ncbi:MAG TPA: Holliday junction resolvase RuvX [Planctomycetota bacterium]|nr:Holliday junction resolvase RuvX [Planctomycetota bacterium]
MKVLALDHGDSRTGLAISAGSIAVALPTVAMKGDGRDADRIAKAAKDAEAERIIVGLPLNMDGTEGPRAKMAREFAESLRTATPLPVEMWDERLSTVEGESRLRAAGLDRREMSKRKDAAAAIVILESYLRKARP